MLSTTTQAVYDDLKHYREANKWPWFHKPWDLNLFILRDETVGTWGDRIITATVDDRRRPVVQISTASSDASRGEWLKPTHRDGCVWVANQHVPGGYELGEHNGRIAWRQRRGFLCVRWPASRGYVPKTPDLVALIPEFGFTDIRGTNLHNRFNGETPEAPKLNDTEGCPLNLYYHEHIAHMELGKQQQRFRGSTIVSPTFAMLKDVIRPRLLASL